MSTAAFENVRGAASPRRAAQQRRTRETEVAVELCLDGTGSSTIDLPLPFFGHMLEAFAKHGRLDLSLSGRGDIEVDPHHLIEDTGLTLGAAVSEALGDRAGIRRFGHAYAPLDEALVRCVLDYSNRPHLEWNMAPLSGRINEFDVSVLSEFVRGFVQSAGVSLHVDYLRGENLHHIAEATFKALGLASRDAFERVGAGVPSTKGLL